ncbi:HNH endonuclease [Cereibacter changlensis]|uniref:HNH endonuclease n=1 Tax=Cereibacter changlensis TaxID=402884 RepID=UPI00403425DB
MARETSEWIGKHDDQKIPLRVQRRVVDRFEGKCAKTGHLFVPGDVIEIDHIIALANGGEHRETNLQPLCGSAHKEKTREDVRTKAKIARVRAKHLNLHRPKQIMAGSKASKWKKPLHGPAYLRSEA